MAPLLLTLALALVLRGPPSSFAVLARTREDTELVAVRGAPLWLPCGAPDPRVAASVDPKPVSILGIAANFSRESCDYDDHSRRSEEGNKKSNQRKNRKNASAGGERPTYDGPREDGDRRRSGPGGKCDRSDGRRRKPDRGAPDGRLERTSSEAEAGKKGRSGKKVRDFDSDAPVKYTWFRDDVEILGNDSKWLVLENGTLHFKKFGGKRGQRPGSRDAGEYRCVIDSANGATLSPTVSLRFASLGEVFESFPSDRTVNEGDAFQLPCSIESYPFADVTWERNNESLPDLSRYYVFPSGALLVTNALKEDSGIYRCLATNQILNKSKYSPGGNIIVSDSESVLYGLNFVNVNELEAQDYNNTHVPRVQNVDAVHGGRVSLACAVRGRPKPKVVWNFRSDAEEFSKEISSMEVLKMANVTEKQSGIYTCIATNDNENIQQVYLLKVLQAPYLEQKPNSELTPTARTVRFNCSAGGIPTPKITWYKDGKLLNITGRIKLKPPGLIISGTITSDKGIYQCVASNALGETEARAVLSVRAPLGVSPPTSVKCLPLTSQSIGLTWEYPISPDVLAFTVHYMLADGGEESLLALDNSKNFTLRNLEPFKRYEIYIRAYMRKGATEPSPHVICHGQGASLKLFMDSNNSILVLWGDAAPFASNIKQWKLQWRQSANKTNVFNVTLPANISFFSVEDINPLVEKYEFRVLASPTDDWLNQDLNGVPWYQGNKSTLLPYLHDDGKGKKDSSPTDSNNLNTDGIRDEGDLGNWSFARPTNVIAHATGPRTVNVTWNCDTAENSLDGYFFIICYSPHLLYNEDEDNPKYNEKCVESDNNWLEIIGLEPNTQYAIKVQSVMQNQKKGGIFSDTILTSTNYDAKSSITDVQWLEIDVDTVKISWTPSLPEKDSKKEKRKYSDNSQVIYTVFYSQDPDAPFEKWESKNVTNGTQIELRDLNATIICYVMVSRLGEEKGTIIAIPARNKSENTTENISSVGVITGIIIAIMILLGFLCICVVYLLKIYKIGQRSQGNQGSQIRTNRVGRSDFECQEPVSSPIQIDSKEAVIYMNGITNAKERGVEEPLLNGQVHITENPRFLPKKHLPNGTCRQLPEKKTLWKPTFGTLDVSRYNELPNVSADTALESDTMLELGRLNCNKDDSLSCSGSVQNTASLFNVLTLSNSNDGLNDSASNSMETINGIVMQVDRNSNSEIPSINRIKESLNCEHKEFSDTNSHTVDLLNRDVQDIGNELRIFNMFDLNSKKSDALKNNCSLDIVKTLDYRENGSSRRLAPALGPNG